MPCLVFKRLHSNCVTISPASVGTVTVCLESRSVFGDIPIDMSDLRTSGGTEKVLSATSLTCGVPRVVNGTNAMVRIRYRDNSSEDLVVTFDPLQPATTSRAKPTKAIDRVVLFIVFI